MNGAIKMDHGKSAPKRYSRKIGRMGNSLGVSLPKSLTDKMNIVQGDEIEFVDNGEGEVLLRKVRHLDLPEHVRPEVLEAFYDVFEEDREIFNDLKDR